MKILKRKNGITLMALVVTIIILLILVGVSIATLTGSNLFENARIAEHKSKNAQEKEEITLNDYENKISEYINGSKREEPVYDESIYDVWTTWLSLGGVENPKQYNAEKILSNQSLMQLLMNSDKALEYMLNSREFILPRVHDSQIALAELYKSNKLVKIPKLEANTDNIITDGIAGPSGAVEKTYQAFDRR